MKKSDDNTLLIKVTTGTILRTLLIVVLVALLWYLRDIILIVLMAIVLASAVEPAVHFFLKYKVPFIGKHIPRLLALVLVYGSGALSIIGLVYFFVPAMITDVSQVVRMLPGTFDISNVDVLQSTSVGKGVAEASLPQVSALQQGLLESANLLDIFKSGIENGSALKSASVFFGGVLSFVLIVVLSFYLSSQERGIENFLRLISPVKSRTYIVDLWKRSQAKIGLWAQGQLMLGVVVGVLVFLIMSLLGIPSALFLAMIAMMFELIPVFGPILAAVPAVSLAFLNGINPLAHAFAVTPGLNAGLIVAGVYFIVQQIESHVIYPEVVRKIVGIPPVLVILALVVGAKMAGFLGIILSVPITAILMEFLNDIAKERKIFDDVS
jgi:predicted PurR-regulated permease PerM